MRRPISVVMSVYNGEQYLRGAIDSILSQSFSNFELIIVDDGSTDTSADIIRSYRDERIKIFRQVNTGLAAALNKGIEISTGVYIARMDADDISFPNRLELQYEFLEKNPSVIAVGSAARWIDAEGNFICTVTKATTHEAILDRLPDSPFIHPSVMFRKEAFYDAGAYPTRLRHGEDTILFNKMAKSGQLCNLNQALISYRIHPGAISRKGKRYESMLLEIVKKCINGDEVSNTDVELLEAMTCTVPWEAKLHDYHMLLAKKWLWDNPISDQARSHLRKAMAIELWDVRAWAMMLLSFLPGSVIQKCYRLVKK